VRLPKQLFLDSRTAEVERALRVFLSFSAIRLTEGGKKDLARLRMMGDLVRKAKDTPLGNLNQQTTLQISLRGSRWETDEAGLLIGIWDEEVKMQVQGKLFQLKSEPSI
jgi:hypothetical protein